MTEEQEYLAAKIYGKLYPPMTKENIQEAYDMGMIPKADLIEGTTYLGHCRNAREAVWKGTHFTYLRTKFGNSFFEDIVCPEDDEGFDIFVAVGVKE